MLCDVRPLAKFVEVYNFRGVWSLLLSTDVFEISCREVLGASCGG